MHGPLQGYHLPQLRWGFILKAEYIRSEDNMVADALSHFQDDLFKA